MLQLTKELPGDVPAIETLLDEAFGPDRRQKTSYRYRQRGKPAAGLSLVARDNGLIVGTVRHWPVLIGPAGAPALLLGPVAVAATHRGQGLGGRLIEESCARAAAAGHVRVLLVGDLAYYHRFGFVPAQPHGISMPGERAERLLLKPLAAGAFDGIAGDVRPVGRASRRRQGSEPNPNPTEVRGLQPA